jgi:hypothetical protein
MKNNYLSAKNEAKKSNSFFSPRENTMSEFGMTQSNFHIGMPLSPVESS